MKKRRGFTLIELLVVIAVIAILAAVLFPVFSKVRDKARQASCSSNERQLGLAVLQYEQDYDEKFPAVFDQGRTPNINWGQEVYPYVKSLNVFTCPSNVIASVTGTMGYDGGQAPFIPTSYAMNGAIGFVNCNGSGGPTGFLTDINDCAQYGPYKSNASITEPSQKVMIMETFVTNPNSHWPDWFTCGGSACTAADATSSNYYRAGFAGHIDFMNVTYIDGHVKTMRAESLATPVNEIGAVDPLSTTSADPNCTQGVTGVAGYTAINCDDVSPTMVAVMSAISSKYK